MPVVSIRLNDSGHHRLRAAAEANADSISSLAERLIDEGLRMDAHPFIVFRAGPAGRRAVVVGGPEVTDVIGAVVGGDVPTSERVARAADLLGLMPAQVRAAVAYYADFGDEIDGELRRRTDLADQHEAAWRRQQAAVAR